MSFAAGNLASNLLGYFREKERGRPFEYKANPMQGLAEKTFGENLPHLVFVGPEGDEVRMARVLKTVAYVAIDEDSRGLVIQKWQIKGHRLYGR